MINLFIIKLILLLYFVKLLKSNGLEIPEDISEDLKGVNDKIKNDIENYNQFVQNYGKNLENFIRVLTTKEYKINAQIDETNNNQLKLSINKLFEILNRVPGGSFLVNLLQKINGNILAKFDSMYLYKYIKIFFIF
uniref:Uncharacterized protein n=1 Tax=Meloidogyne enterolobii TaxID=390850 RepID=A0A6V7UT85_MELEN|nr:unnamed protein product [Meloidogyne enterolobii]